MRMFLDPVCPHQRLRLKRFVPQSALGLGQLRCSQAVHRHGFRKREKKIPPGIPGFFGPHWESAFGLGRLRSAGPREETTVVGESPLVL